jgi:hypothetical protein
MQAKMSFAQEINSTLSATSEENIQRLKQRHTSIYYFELCQVVISTTGTVARSVYMNRIP